jgi:hypothetical protein
MYTMGIYLLTEDVHHKIDSAKARFYWDSGQKKKYHMVKWDELARPKDLGGLSFTETRLMNMCLLSRWIFMLEIGIRICVVTSWGRNILEERVSLAITIEEPHSFGKGFMMLKLLSKGDETHTWGWEEDQILVWGLAGWMPTQD